MLTAEKWNPNQSRDNIGRFGSGSAKQAKTQKDEITGHKTGAVPGDYQGKGQHPLHTSTPAGKPHRPRGGRGRARKLTENRMYAMRLFAPITKVDEAKRLVYLRVADETPDRADEVFDYAESRPYFENWSKNQFEASGGKSYGNVRAMHGKSAAGIVFKPLDFSDSSKAIDAVIKVTDDQDWSKCLDGTYTGGSIGGSYVKKTDQIIGEKTYKRYVADPAEISLVDSPCIPTARFFDVIKADGAIEKREFKATELKIEATPQEVDDFTKALVENKVALKDVMGWISEFAADKAADAMLLTAEAIEKMDDVAKREFSSDERKAAAKQGQALPDGSFPIKTVGDLENAIRAYGRAKDKAAAKAHIIKRAKALGASDKIPEAWTKDSGKAAGGDLKKGMYTVQSMAECLSCLASIASQCESEDEWEKDNSAMPAKMRNLVEDAIELFKEMSEEETEELLSELKTQANVGDDDEIEMAMEMALKVGTLKKRLTDPALPVVELAKICEEHKEPLTSAAMADMPALVKRILEKAGARHSKLDMQHLQAAHDHLVDMGADCDSDGEKGAKRGDLSKGNAEVVALKTLVEEQAARLKRLEDQPVPYVTLRAVGKATPAETQPTSAGTAKPEPINLTKDDYILNADGTVNMPATMALKSLSPAAA